MCLKEKDVHESICQRGVEVDSQRWRGRRQGFAHIHCGLEEREQFIISARLECINCLGCRKFTFYTTLAVLFLMKVTAVKLMCGITVRTKRRYGREEGETSRGEGGGAVELRCGLDLNSRRTAGAASTLQGL